MADDTPDAPPPDAPLGYHAAIGAKGGRKRSLAQSAQLAAQQQRARKWTPEQEAAALAAYHAREATPAQLAKKYGLSRSGVWYAIRRAKAKAEEAAKEAAGE